jgi:hypothetical protein
MRSARPSDAFASHLHPLDYVAIRRQLMIGS